MNESIIQILRSFLHKTSQWSGGTTTELYIYPEGAEYAKRNFDFRISSAVVECERSEFTALPGVHRYLMILDGEIRIEHEARHSAVLGEFDVDEFSGDWNTVSFGRATDFNLMCRNGARGGLKAHKITGKEKITLPGNYSYIGFYLYSGSAALQFGTENAGLQKGDFLLISGLSGLSELYVSTPERIELIEVQVSL